MKTDINTIASFMAATIWADCSYDESEKITVSEIADALELDETIFYASVEAELAKVQDMSENEITEYLSKAGDKVADEEIGIIYEAAMQMVLADEILAYSEVTNLLTIAEALGLTEEYAILLLADMLKSEPELDIDFNAE